ncbi:hypothetical protein BBO99_00000198 [Phytophthora kernoviae]|uniref:Tr-type G domain-containing protein n=1 Tax=Phytophthora kernoviae TaxID=325452 RepID=A0A3R7HP52_9STRA|nr:hypothetical protein BBI17_000300 [Phytophthora kernoviae]RLN85791.1 hypothetical protein BBO99_00000198 [Phytophthora kernoviae]
MVLREEVGLAALRRLVCAEFAKPTMVAKAEQLPEEVEEGNIEYKQQLLGPSADRLRQLTTQMHWRLNEGGGVAFYELGVSDNGVLLGLEEDAMLRSLGTLARMCRVVHAEMTLSTFRAGRDANHKAVRIQLTRILEHNPTKRLQVSVIGDFESGKSTLVGVLTRGCLDDGAGLARMQVCRHRHELENGRTSSVSEHTIAVALDGHFRCTDELDTCDFGDSDEDQQQQPQFKKQESFITLSDLAGHKKYLKSTASGLAGQFPDYAMLVVDATVGVQDMTREHIKIASALEVAIFVVLTKTDQATAKRIQQSLVEIADLLQIFCPCQRVILAPKSSAGSKEDVVNMTAASVVPVFQVSSVDGSGLDVLQGYLAALEPKRVWAVNAKRPAEFQINQAYDIEDEGTVVTGLVQAGTLCVGERLLLGPNSHGQFCDVAVESIEVQHKAAQSLSAGETGAVLVRFLSALQPTNTTHRIRKGTMLVHPSAVIHTGQVRQMAKIVRIGDPSVSVTGIRTTSPSTLPTLCRFEFMYWPEYIRPDLPLVLRDGKSTKQQEEEPKKKIKVHKRRGARAQTIEEIFATLSSVRSSGLNPPSERIVLTPRSAEACLRCGINPETLKIRDLDSFYDPDVTPAAQRMRHEAYSLRRHEEMQSLRDEKRKLLEAEDRAAGSGGPPRVVVVSGLKRATSSSKRAALNSSPPILLSSSPGKKSSSALLDIERQRLEKVKQRQERELGQMLEFEMKMNQLQQAAAEKMEREKRQHEAMERSRVRYAQELAADKRAKEIKKKAQQDAEEERRKELAAQLAARDRALAEEKSRQEKLRRIEAREREEERKIKAEEHRAQTDALLHAQQLEVQERLRELDLAERAREEMVEQQRAERALVMDARRREVTQRIRRNLRASKKLEASRKKDIQRKQAASEALRRAHEEEECRSRELQAQQQVALEKKRQLVLEEARREEGRKKEELLERQRENDLNVQQVQRNQQDQRTLRSEYRKLQAQLKLDKVERMKRIQEYQRLEMLRKMQDTEVRTQHMLDEKDALVHRRKQLAIKTKIQRDLIMRTMENVKITKKWHQASKKIEKVLNGGATFQINLGASLGTFFSGGIILFQSLVVLFGNAFFEFVYAFSDDGKRDKMDNKVTGEAWSMTTGCFGVGIVVNYCLGLLVKKLTPSQRQSVFAQMHAGDTFQASLAAVEAGTPELKSPVDLMQSCHFLRMDEGTKEKLQLMGILNVIAISIHNIPEGVATMVASSEHTFIGLTLAIGVGLHNVAEGIVVATPVYFATGSRWRGIVWCAVASISQHLGGFLAFGILGRDADNFSHGVLYSVTAGMLTCINIKDVLPTAHVFANGRVHLVSAGALFGMVFMSASLILFKYIGV